MIVAIPIGTKNIFEASASKYSDGFGDPWTAYVDGACFGYGVKQNEDKAELEELRWFRDQINKNVIQGHSDTIDSAMKLIVNLRKEVEILRLYGNKECTAQADERLIQEGIKK